MPSWLKRMRQSVNGDLIVCERQVRLPNWPALLDGLRIAHVSDLHFLKWNSVLEQAQQTLARLSCDLIAVTGDFCMSRRSFKISIELVRRFFRPLHAPLGIFGVRGNHDPPCMTIHLADTPLRLIDEQTCVLRANGAPFNLVGVGIQGRTPAERLDKTMGSRDPHAPTVVLTHYPSTVRHVRPYRPDLVLAGHTHGGQVRFPWLGCVFPHDAIHPTQAYGLNHVSGVWLHVTAGVGTTGPFDVRVNCPPEITLLHLHG